MEKSEFECLFARVVESALKKAEEKIGENLPRNLVIEMHAFGLLGAPISFNEAANYLFLSEREFFKIIDVMVMRHSEISTYLFVRPSGHPKGEYSQTWSPQTDGPFKILEAEEILFVNE